MLNLLTNALNAIGSGGKVGLSSRLHSGHWQIVLEDTGPGLSNHQLTEVFEPFVRIDLGNPQDHETGSGLGLTICRRIVNLHGGTIRLENRIDHRGLRAIVEFPRRSYPEAPLEQEAIEKAALVETDRIQDSRAR